MSPEPWVGLLHGRHSKVRVPLVLPIVACCLVKRATDTMIAIVAESAPVHTNVPHIFILLVILCGVNCMALISLSSGLAPYSTAPQFAQQHVGSSDPHMSRARHSTCCSITPLMQSCRAGTTDIGADAAL